MRAKRAANSVVTTEWVGDEIHLGFPKLGKQIFDMNWLDPIKYRHSAFHGMTQRLSNATAIPWEQTQGWTEEQREKLKYDNVAELIEWLSEPTNPWKMTGGGQGRDGGLFLAALMELSGESEDKVRAQMEKAKDNPKIKAHLEALRKSKEVIEIISRLRLERADTKVDVSTTLKGFMTEE